MIDKPKNGDFVSLVEILSTSNPDAIHEETKALLQSHVLEEGDDHHLFEDVSSVKRSDSSKATSFGYSIIFCILTVAVIVIFFEEGLAEIYSFFYGTI